MRGSDRGGICFQAMKQQRWARAALLLCLTFFFFFLFFIAGRPSSGSLTRKHRHQHHRHKVDHVKPQAAAEAANEVPADVVHRRVCGLRKVGLLCAYLTPAEKNESLVDDDKRIVPTGPNPLHNR